MKRLINLLAWSALAVVAALSALNWATLTAQAPLDLFVAQIQAPLGVVLLGMAGVLVALFFVAYLRTQVETLLETRKLLREVQRVQGLADKAEESRIEKLHKLISSEFRLLNERLSAASAVSARPVAGAAEPAPGLIEVVSTRVQPR